MYIQVLSRVIVNLKLIEDSYRLIKAQPCELGNHKEQLIEFFSLLHPIADLIRECQASVYSTGALGLFTLITLRMSLLDCEKSLTILDASTKSPIMVDVVNE